CLLLRRADSSARFPYTTLFRSDAALRSNAVGSVVASWASQDPDGAEQWVLGLPRGGMRDQALQRLVPVAAARTGEVDRRMLDALDRKSTRLNSSHVKISYAVFC